MYPIPAGLKDHLRALSPKGHSPPGHSAQGLPPGALLFCPCSPHLRVCCLPLACVPSTCLRSMSHVSAFFCPNPLVCPPQASRAAFCSLVGSCGMERVSLADMTRLESGIWASSPGDWRTLAGGQGSLCCPPDLGPKEGREASTLAQPAFWREAPSN